MCWLAELNEKKYLSCPIDPLHLNHYPKIVRARGLTPWKDQLCRLKKDEPLETLILASLYLC